MLSHQQETEGDDGADGGFVGLGVDARPQRIVFGRIGEKVAADVVRHEDGNVGQVTLGGQLVHQSADALVVQQARVQRDIERLLGLPLPKVVHAHGPQGGAIVHFHARGLHDRPRCADRESDGWLVAEGAQQVAEGFDTCLINTDLLRQAKDSLRANERVVLTPKSKLVDLGFKTISYDGLEIADDYDVPDLTGYLFSWENIELHSMQDQLVAYERDKKIETSDDLYSADFYGQMRFESPALFGKIYSVTTGT